VTEGIAFARTLRALEADAFRTSTLGLAAAAILLGAWTWWMFAASVPQYESTTHVRIESRRVLAYFSPAVLARIHVGEPARVHINGTTFAARVQTVATDQAELLLAANPQSPTPASSPASVEIETTRVSRASIALRSLARRNR
jgi:multidrug resistance efflux pump